MERQLDEVCLLGKLCQLAEAAGFTFGQTYTYRLIK